MSTSYLGSIIKHLTEIVETLEEGGTVISPRRLGQVVQTQLCVQADTTRLRHGIQHLTKLDAVHGDERLVKDEGNEKYLYPPKLLGPRPGEPVDLTLNTDGEEWVHIPHLIGDKVLIDGDITATVSEVLLYGRNTIRYKCEYFDRGENRTPWIQGERLQAVDPNP